MAIIKIELNLNITLAVFLFIIISLSKDKSLNSSKPFDLSIGPDDYKMFNTSNFVRITHLERDLKPDTLYTLELTINYLYQINENSTTIEIFRAVENKKIKKFKMKIGLVYGSVFVIGILGGNSVIYIIKCHLNLSLYICILFIYIYIYIYISTKPSYFDWK